MRSAVVELECELFLRFTRLILDQINRKELNIMAMIRIPIADRSDLLEWFRWHFFPFLRLFSSSLLNQMLMTISSPILISGDNLFRASWTLGGASVGIRFSGSSVIESRGDNFLKSLFAMTSSCRKTWGCRRNWSEALLTRFKRRNDSSWQTCYRLFADGCSTLKSPSQHQW